MDISKQIKVINQAFLKGLKAILNEKLYAVFIYGSAAFPDVLSIVDIDFHVILKSNLTNKERSELEKLHKLLSQRFPPLGGELDGYYILLKDARLKSSPKSQMWKRVTDNSWALHREHILAGRYIHLFGSKPEEIYQPTMWLEIENALCGELNYVEKHLKDYPGYCILNLCRLIYSFKTRDVVISKAKASEWAYKVLPEWQKLIKLARKSYNHQATLKDKQFLNAEVRKFFEFAERYITKLSKKRK